LSRVRKVLATAVISSLILGALSAPALAINHAVIPANECSGNVASGGVAAAGNFVSQTDQRGGPVGLPVSGTNPGASLGAEGDNALINNQSDRC
jgi:hypothetical protein